MGKSQAIKGMPGLWGVALRETLARTRLCTRQLKVEGARRARPSISSVITPYFLNIVIVNYIVLMSNWLLI